MKKFNLWLENRDNDLFVEANGQWIPVQKNPNVKLLGLPVEKIIEMAGGSGQVSNPMGNQYSPIWINRAGQYVRVKSKEGMQTAKSGEWITVAETGAAWPQKAKNMQLPRNRPEGERNGWQVFTPLGKGFAQQQTTGGTVEAWGQILPYGPGDYIIADNPEGTEGRRPVEKGEFNKTWTPMQSQGGF